VKCALTRFQRPRVLRVAGKASLCGALLVVVKIETVSVDVLDRELR